MVDVRAQVLVTRPRAQVASFMFDPRNDPLWTTGLVECHPSQPGLLATGHEVQRVSKMLGRRLEYLIVVTDHEPERSVDMKTDKPFRMEIRYQLDDDGTHTRASIHARAAARRSSRWRARCSARWFSAPSRTISRI